MFRWVYCCFSCLHDTIGHGQLNTIAGEAPNAETYREGIVCAVRSAVRRPSLALDFERAVGNRSEHDPVDSSPTAAQTYAEVMRFLDQHSSSIVCAHINLADGQYSITTPSQGFYIIVWVLSGGQGKPSVSSLQKQLQNWRTDTLVQPCAN